MKRLFVSIVYDENETCSEEIKDYIREFITGNSAYVLATFSDDSDED